MNIEAIRQELQHIDEVTPLEGSRYAACLQTYEAASNQRELIIRWFCGGIIPQLPAEQASILSVGCGEGELDINLLSAAQRHVGQLDYTGLEPDPQQCEAFVARLQGASENGTRIAAHNARFEEFTTTQPFDLVLMVHSLYYMEDPAQALDAARKLVSENGKLAILLASNDQLNELSSSFWAKDDSGETWFSEDLTRHLEQQGIPYSRERIAATLDVTACFDPDSEEGKQVADFVAQVPTAELPHDMQTMIFSYLKATSQRDGDTRWLPHNVDAFVIG